MNILGLSVGVTSSAALMIDGKLVAAVSEERLNRIKNYDGFPTLAIEECLKIAGITNEDIDRVAWGGMAGASAEQYITNRYCSFKVSDLINEQENYWKPIIFNNEEVDFLDLFSEKINTAQFPGKEHLSKLIDEKNLKIRDEKWRDLYKKLPFIGNKISEDKNVFINHHLSHASYAANGMDTGSENTLIFTLDGSGDNENATVWKYHNGEYEKLYGTSEFILGRYYRHATLLLGMKMVEDEYKVMGLAPYGKPYHSDLPYSVYADTLEIKGTEINFKNKPDDAYFYFKERLKASRFDGIAAGIQRYVEDIVCDWVNNWMKKTGIRNIALSGGVSMNIKTNMEIAERCSPANMYVPGSGSDESLAIGACYYLSSKLGIKTYPLKNLYLGNDIDQNNVIDLLKKKKHSHNIKIIEKASNEEIATHLEDGKILGRCSGKMEFGARAQGNRSIIADPRNIKTVQRLNDKIKNRDFWMPFAPSIIEEMGSSYLNCIKGVNYQHMSVGARTTQLGKKSLIAGLHPADLTARPNIISNATNPNYHKLMKAFKAKTGVGALLNTSLNIHGFPIVRTEKEAFDVLDKTDIDGMIIGDSLVLKNEHKQNIQD